MRPFYGAGLLLGLLLPCSAAISAPPPGIDLDSPLHQWFDRQHSVKGVYCCNVSDGHILDEEDWRSNGRGYEARIQGAWEAIPDDALRDPIGGPNPTGKAVIWNIGKHVFCFAPGTQM